MVKVLGLLPYRLSINRSNNSQMFECVICLKRCRFQKDFEAHLMFRHNRTEVLLAQKGRSITHARSTTRVHSSYFLGGLLLPKAIEEFR